ncbi:MAG: hypothetical protein ACRD9W_02640 [Terriglobia bacterium]
MPSALGQSGQLQSLPRQATAPQTFDPDPSRIAAERLNQIEADMSRARTNDEGLVEAGKRVRPTIFARVMFAGALVLAVAVILLPPPVSWPDAVPQPFRAIAIVFLAFIAAGELLYGSVTLMSVRKANSSEFSS